MARRWRWSRTGACPPCRIPASGWCGRVRPRGSTSAWCPARARRSRHWRSAGCRRIGSCSKGFLPRKAGERRARFEALATDPRTIVVFESPKRVRAMVAEALDALGDRPAAVARELTKLHEEVIRGQLSELPAMLDAATLKGEVVVVIGGAERPAPMPPTSTQLVEETRALVADGERASRRGKGRGRSGIVPRRTRSTAPGSSVDKGLTPFQLVCAQTSCRDGSRSFRPVP